MDQKKLQQIYPFSQVVSQPKDDELFINLPFETHFLALNRAKLSPSELELLISLFIRPTQTPNDYTQHPWHGFLFGNTTLEEVTGSYRVIQFKLLSDVSIETQKTWLNAFTSMFNHVSDAFFVNDSYGVIIEEKSKDNYDLNDLTGILMTLESDFMFKTRAFLGSFFNMSQGFPRFFKEEKQIFLTEYLLVKGAPIFSLPQVVLHYFTAEGVKNSLILQVFRKQLSIDMEMKEIIITLWRNQGNISSTAKELFMHRNTLQYRLEKFNEQTGLSLKSMDDLVLSYLLVL